MSDSARDRLREALRKIDNIVWNATTEPFLKIRKITEDAIEQITDDQPAAPDGPEELIAKWQTMNHLSHDRDGDMRRLQASECASELESWWASRASGPAPGVTDALSVSESEVDSRDCQERLKSEAGVSPTPAQTKDIPETGPAPDAAMRTPGEEAWVDELANCGGNTRKLCTVLRAYRANLLSQTGPALQNDAEGPNGWTVDGFNEWFENYSSNYSKDQWRLQDAWAAAMVFAQLAAQRQTDTGEEPG